MKKTILVLCAISTLMVAQPGVMDISGQYKLSGVDVMYTFVTRPDHTNAVDGSWTLTVTDAYGLGVTQGIATIPASVPFGGQAM